MRRFVLAFEGVSLTSQNVAANTLPLMPKTKQYVTIMLPQPALRA